jgi:membrane protein implicated in regulation of membrane protease activity
MAQLIFLAVLIGGSLLLYRRFIKDAERLAKKSRQEEKERQTGAMGTLIKDPETGEYRVKREDEV